MSDHTHDVMAILSSGTAPKNVSVIFPQSCIVLLFFSSPLL